MRRRDFIKGIIAATTVALPGASRAQQLEQMRHIGVLMNVSESNSDGQARLAEFLKELEQLGWTPNRNVRIDVRWTSDVDPRRYAAEPITSSKAGGLIGNRQRRF